MQYIVYVVEFNGAMIEFADVLRLNLILALSKLKPDQRFNIVLLCGAAVRQFRRHGLVSATRENREDAVEFLDSIHVTGMPKWPSALREAFRLIAEGRKGNSPALLQVACDGGLSPSNKEALALVAKLNRGRHVRINTYWYFSSNAKVWRDAAGEQALKQMAAEHGGTFTAVDFAD